MKEIKFYRCVLCGTIINQWDIVSGKGCRKCGGRRMNPTNLSLLEKIKEICRHPKVWRWNDVG